MESKDMDIDDATTSAATSSRHRIVPWVEKYRPSKVEDVSHQDEVLKTLKTSIEQGNLPHLLFHGSPGKFSKFPYVTSALVFYFDIIIISRYV